MADFWGNIISDMLTIGILLVIGFLIASKYTKKPITQLIKDLIGWFKDIGGGEE